ncbi:GAF domain-like protein [Aspergillus flavus]|uniref:GAF domain-like protein n=1 Tax=Aspergillus flavus TaxID=5059 RepID=A0A5N6H4R0_ASPFL|nr:GAF domain-like protein [Aspergillus flavus]
MSPIGSFYQENKANNLSPTPIHPTLAKTPPNPTSTRRSSNRRRVLYMDSVTGNFSNVASLLWHAYAALPSPSPCVNWAGFYIRQDKFPNAQTTEKQNQNQKQVLWLGPFQGRPACQEIRFGKGVCGTAAEKRETVLVGDVLSFPGHIACDASSRSEIVVPVLVGGETVAIIDIDCTEPDGFDEVDRKYLEDLAKLLAEACDW